MSNVRSVLGSSDIAVLSPHSDDAALSLGGTLTLAASQGCGCIVVTLFSRSRRTRTGGVEADEERVTAMRKREDLAFATMLGGACCVWCDLPDPSVRLPDVRDQWYVPRPFSERERGYVSQVVYFCREHADDRVLLAPAGLGANRDHLIVREAALALARQDERPLFLYEDLPYAARAMRGSVAREIADLAEKEVFDVEPRLVSNRLMFLGKRRALDAYASQVNRDIRTRVLGYALCVGGFATFTERLWRVSFPATSRAYLHRKKTSSAIVPS